jgi:hypothetical protein
MIVLVLVVLVVLGYAAWYKLDTARSWEAHARACQGPNDGPSCPEQNRRTYELVMAHNARLAHNRAVVNGHIRPRPSTTSQRVDSGLLLGALAFSAYRHFQPRSQSGGGPFNPVDLGQRR